MKTIRVNEYGDYNVLKLEEKPTPKPNPGEALIKLKTAGLNFIDIYMRMGMPRVSVPTPYTPGREGAGIVESIGENVTAVKPGDAVAFVGQIGSYAEYICVDAEKLIPLPQSISFEQGAAFPLQGMTAHYLVHDHYPVKPGDTVLVHAAAGGVGLLTVQWLKHLGARVIGTVSTPEKAAMARAAGADEIIIYTQEDFVEAGLKLTNNKGVDYIIDGVGKTTFTKNLELVRTRGWICIFGSASGLAEPLMPNALQAKSVTISGGMLFNYLQSRSELLRRANDVMQALADGWLKMKIDHVFPLEQASEAQHQLETRQTMGKVILEIS
jgi:NADPH2:quinone reductase